MPDDLGKYDARTDRRKSVEDLLLPSSKSRCNKCLSSSTHAPTVHGHLVFCYECEELTRRIPTTHKPPYRGSVEDVTLRLTKENAALKRQLKVARRRFRSAVVSNFVAILWALWLWLFYLQYWQKGM